VLPHYKIPKEDEKRTGKKVVARKPYEDRNLREILFMLYRKRKYVRLAFSELELRKHPPS